MEQKYSDFYEFGGALVCTTFTARPEICLQLRENKEFAKSKEFTDLLAYGDYDNMLPLIWKQDRNYGNKLRDVLYCGQSLYLISDRFKSILNESGLTGWKTYPILLYDKKGSRIDGYNGFSITGRGGNMHKFDSPPIELGYSPKSDGYYLKFEAWDGSDIFRVFPHHIIITKRFAEALITHKVSGIDIDRLTDYGDWSKSKRIL